MILDEREGARGNSGSCRPLNGRVAYWNRQNVSPKTRAQRARGRHAIGVAGKSERKPIKIGSLRADGAKQGRAKHRANHSRRKRKSNDWPVKIWPARRYVENRARNCSRASARADVRLFL